MEDCLSQARRPPISDPRVAQRSHLGLDGARQVWQGGGGILVGVALIAYGGYQLVTRRSLVSGASLGLRVQRRATMWGVIVFGMAYAVASLGCTLPIFMTVVSSVFAGEGGLMSSVAGFLEYAAGLGVVLTLITFGIALFREQTTRVVSRALPYVGAVGNVLLVLAGSYLVWYWIELGQLI